eukprot:INCI5564.1.p1 GENE.INCI5564.1~~INCI5564.1.p1  ORF type:complete len:361 (+),score=45.15 INCI5564.1:256-1338(+)
MLSTMFLVGSVVVLLLAVLYWFVGTPELVTLASLSTDLRAGTAVEEAVGGIGLPVSDQAHEPESDAPKGLRVVTQNLWAHYFATPLGKCYAPVAPSMAKLPFQNRLRMFAKQIAAEEQPVDIVLVQEVFVLRIGPFVFTANFRAFADEMKSAGFAYHTEPLASIPRWFGQNSGCAIFSRLPLKAEVSHRFIHSDEALNNKGLVAAVVEVARRPVLLVSTHLDSRKPATRLRQVQQIGQFLKARRRALDRACGSHGVGTSAPYPCRETTIVAGDFNIDAAGGKKGGHGLFEGLETAMGEGAGLRSLWADHPVLTCHGMALDHLFFRDADWTQTSRQVRRYTDSNNLAVADHLGLAVSLEQV